MSPLQYTRSRSTSKLLKTYRTRDYLVLDSPYFTDRGPIRVGEFSAEEGGYYAGRYTYQADGYSSMLLGGDTYDLYVAPKSGGESSSLRYKDSLSCDGNHDTVSTTAPNSSYDGYYNTYTSVLGSSGAHPAAIFCRNLVLNGKSDWYLGASYEMTFAFNQLKNLPLWQSGSESFQTTGGTNSGGYWTSSGDSCSNTGVLTSAGKWFQLYGLVSGYPKTDIQYVRAMRRVLVV